MSGKKTTQGNGKKASQGGFDIRRYLPIIAAVLLIIVYLVFFDGTLPGIGIEPDADEYDVLPTATARPNADEKPYLPVEEETQEPAKPTPEPEISGDEIDLSVPFTLVDMPEYRGNPYELIHDGKPYFDTEKDWPVFECFSPLDDLGRCGTCFANVCRELMPTEKRGDIYWIKPTGWKSVQYDFVDGGSLYNRCHLLGFKLTGENDNERNLITGTRSMNTLGMLPFEDLIDDYVKETNSHVLYRVTPLFEGDNLVADGVVMEGWSVEDQGESVCFAAYAFNVEPGVEIDYATGQNWEK